MRQEPVARSTSNSPPLTSGLSQRSLPLTTPPTAHSRCPYPAQVRTPAAAGGNGGAGISLSPSSVSFGNQPVEVASSPETTTLSNNSGTALSISSLAFTGADPADFTENNTCGSSVATGGTCTIVTVFTPSASGSRSASLSVTDNVSGSPQTVALSGTATHERHALLERQFGSGGIRRLPRQQFRQRKLDAPEHRADHRDLIHGHERPGGPDLLLQNHRCSREWEHSERELLGSFCDRALPLTPGGQVRLPCLRRALG